MSEIRVTTLKDTSGGNSSTTADIFSGRAKAWVNFNGTGVVAIRAQYNVSSITDNGTGDYTVNFTNAMTDANYSCVGTSSPDSGNSKCIFTANSTAAGVPTASTTSSIRVCAYFRADGSAADTAYIHVSVFR